MDELVTRLGAIKPDESFFFFGAKTLKDGLDVFVLHRNYPASVKPDHVKRYRLQHDYSRVVFGINSERSSLILKVANRAISEIILNWVEDTLSCELVITGGLYSGYDSNSVADSFLGQYDESFGIDIVAIDFRYTSLPGGSPLILKAAEYNRSIREELYWLRTQGVLRLGSLADINSVNVRYLGVEAQICCQPEKGGAVTMRLQDAGLEEQHIAGLKEAFQKTFMIPLGQRVDPTMMVMGATEIYQYLLSGVDQNQVRTYQNAHLKRLMDWKLIQATNARVGKCTNPNCANYSHLVTEANKGECPACQTPLKWEEFTRYERDPKKTALVIRQLLQKATGWKFSADTKNVESQKLHKLSLENNPGKLIYVFISDRMSPVKIESLQRTMFPILVVHPTGDQRAPVIDSGGIAHIGLPHVLATREDKTSRMIFRASFEKIVRRLLQMEQERVFSASRHSRDMLEEKPQDYDDRKFEADIYNILRRLFPYSMKWGGRNRPDGFCSLIYFDTSDLSKPIKLNLSYDAKYSETTYDFGVEEHRQMFDYICSIGRSKRLQTEGNQYDGHMIITNSMKESSMRLAAEYLWTQHRLAKLRPEFLIIFLRESFLKRLWDLVHDNTTELAKRWVFFAETVVTAIKSAERDGYHLLEETHADEIVKQVLLQPLVENPINHDLLNDDMSYTLATKAKGLGKVPRAS